MSRPTSDATSRLPAGAIVVLPGAGRAYGMGAMQSVFMADGDETDDRYTVSEWWLDPHGTGPGPHLHAANEELFYVVEGTMTFLVGTVTVDAPRGSFLRVPAGVTHDFNNRTAERAGILNVYIPGGFEAMMPSIVAWYAARDESSGR